MNFLLKAVREPLIQFLLIGAAVFGLYSLTTDREEYPRDTVIVSEARVQQLVQVFAKTWQRPPTAQELRGLIDAYIKEDIYYREAIKLGLDRDDTLIRRRMQQKMEFLKEPNEELLAADDRELQAFLDANKSEFRIEPRFEFQQVFINPQKEGESARDRAARVLATLKTSSPGDASFGVSDPTLLPDTNALSPLSAIARSFGETFALALTKLPENQWTGPIESPFGLHVVRVTARKDGYDPPLKEMREAVERRWRARKRDDFQNQEYDRLRAKYDVVVETDAAAPPPAERDK